MVNCVNSVGSTACSWLALATVTIDGEWSWRSLTLLQCVPGVLVLACIYWIPESPRWLVAQERYEQAEDMLVRYHGSGDPTNETVAFEFEEMKKTIVMELSEKKSSSYLDFLRTAGNRYRLIILLSLCMVSQYSGSNLFSNYANKIYIGAGITEQTDKILVSECVRAEVSRANHTLSHTVKRRPNDPRLGRVRQQLPLHRPPGPATALPNFDNRNFTGIHGLDDH